MSLRHRPYICFLSLLAVVLLLVTGCKKDANEEANKLFVQAQQLLEKAEKQQRPADKLPILHDAEDHLKSIVSEYPSANLAVQLASGQSVGQISFKGVADTIAEVSEAACFETPSRACLIEQAVRTGQSAKDGVMLQFGCSTQGFNRVGFLAQVAVNQKQAGMEKASQATFEEALRSSEESKQSPDLRNLFLAPALASAGRSEEALRLLEGVSDPERRAYGLLSIARAQAAAGYKTEAAATFDQAIKLKPEETDDVRRASALIFLARLRIALGQQSDAIADIDRARALISSNPTYLEVNTLANMADIQASLGKSADANSTLSKALSISQNQNAKDCYVYDIFNAHPALSGIVDISRIANSLNNENMRSAVLYYGVVGKAEAGRIDDAQEIARSIKVEYFNTLALISIAHAQSKARLSSQASQTLSTALRMAKSIQDSRLRATALLASIRALPAPS
jgi:tetratricopeptide (TPR) repeat protein